MTFNVGYSTDLGGSAGVTWSHRDLFGNAEQLNVTAAITGAGGTADSGIGYDAKVQFLKPDYYHRDQTLELDLEGLKQNLDSYDQTALIAGPVLTRKLSKEWSASVGLTATQERIIQEGTTRDYTTSRRADRRTLRRHRRGKPARRPRCTAYAARPPSRPPNPSPAQAPLSSSCKLAPRLISI